MNFEHSPQPAPDPDSGRGDYGWHLLPGWMLSRMAWDSWSFGLLMSNGITICIESVERAYQAADGAVWIDVLLATDMPYTEKSIPKPFICPTDRQKASINTRHVVAAFETADT